MKLLSLVGARPQFVKEALVGEAVRQTDAWEHILVHSGQHYDAAMSDVFFTELGIPEPKYHLGVGSGSHGAMTAAVLAAVEKVLQQEKPDGIIVYGDTNTTLAGALAAAKLHIPIVHVEAGIRMDPQSMPEEINRVLTDRISAVMCCCSQLGADNLRRENLTQGVHVTGDVMYDLFLRMRHRFTPEKACRRLGVEAGRFVIATLHRDFNVDKPESLRGCLEGLSRLGAAGGLSVLLPLHPRTRKNMAAYNCADAAAGVTLLDPLGYLDLMSLVEAAALVVTDSGGLQKEAFYAGKRCVVIMPDTGWRELTDCGWNVPAAPDARAIETAGLSALETMPHPGSLYGEGDAAKRIVRAVLEELA
jgi:UDP-N-acetylglucosamine 2-epimerase (non-hydrolysing)